MNIFDMNVYILNHEKKRIEVQEKMEEYGIDYHVLENPEFCFTKGCLKKHPQKQGIIFRLMVKEPKKNDAIILREEIEAFIKTHFTDLKVL